MPLNTFICGAAILCGVCCFAHADVRVEVPRTSLEAYFHANPVTPAALVSTSLELGASSWAPADFTVASRLTQVPFQRSGLPGLYLNLVTSVLPEAGVNVKLGANWLSLERKASLTTGGVLIPESQTLQLLSLRAGVEYVLPIQSTIQSYVGVSAFPSIAMTSRSTFDDGAGYFGIPAEFALGSRIPFKTMGIGWDGAGLNLGLVDTLGSIKNSSVTGFGINGGVSVSL